MSVASAQMITTAVLFRLPCSSPAALPLPYDQSYTLFNASKHYQFNQDIAFFKSGWAEPITSSSAISSTICPT